MSPLYQTLTSNGTLQLDPDITYLRATGVSTGPYTAVLPNGNFIQQMKRIYIPTDVIANTATWTITGTFAGGFTSLTMNTLGYSAFLEWDSAGWQIVAGNAIPNPS